jgi:restriction endonuclease S subunit
LRSEYIHLLLRMPEIRNAATRYFVGSAGQQRVPKEFLENLHIPILPINVQEKLISMAKSDGTKIAEKRKIILARREKHMETFEKMILGLRPVEDIENVPC